MMFSILCLLVKLVSDRLVRFLLISLKLVVCVLMVGNVLVRLIGLLFSVILFMFVF